MMSTLRRMALFVVTLSSLLGACAATPEERLVQARAAAEEKNMEAFSKFFTRQSASFLRDMQKAAARSKIPYLKDPYSILPEGDIEEVTTEGLSTIIKVKGKRGSDEIRMFMENDEWSIDVYSLKALWKPLKGDRS
jgi:hypothetical protein